MAYGESNVHVTDNNTRRWKANVMTPIRLGQNIWKAALLELIFV